MRLFNLKFNIPGVKNEVLEERYSCLAVSDDERLYGIPHIAVGYVGNKKCFTVPAGYLEEILPEKV